MNEANQVMKRVAVLPWPGIKNCFLCVSGQKKRQEMRGEKWYDNHQEHTNNFDYTDFRTEPRVTFAYVEDGVAAEWDGAYGPIQLWFRCEEGYEDGYDKARPHWLWPFAYGNGHWSQIAVEEHGLPQAFNTGDFGDIFEVLLRFVKSRLNEER